MEPTTALTAHAILVLLWASWLDHRHRRVPNTVWITAVIIAVPLWIWWITQDPSTAFMQPVTAMPTILAALLLWFGKQIGGADVKGVTILASTLPHNLSGTHFIPAFDAFTLALIIGWVGQRLLRRRGVAFYPILLVATITTVYVGGVVWYPLWWLRDALAEWITQ